MKQRTCNIYPFLEAVRGNWRNAVFLDCTSCPYGRTEECKGHLVTADAEGKLIVMPVFLFQRWTGQQVEKEECMGILEQEAFVRAFPLYLEWHTVSDETCLLLQLSAITYGGFGSS